MFLKLFLISIILIAVVMLAMGLKALLTKKGSSYTSSCCNNSQNMKDKGVQCGCQTH